MSSILVAVVGNIAEIKGVVDEMLAGYGLDALQVKVIFKVIGIAYIAQFAADACRDAGEGAIASKVELAGRVLIVATAMPAMIFYPHPASKPAGVRMKRRLFLAVALLILLILPCAAYGEPADDAALKDAMSAYDFSDWQSYMDALPDEVRSIWDYAGIDEILYGLSNGTADYEIDLNDISHVFTAALREKAQEYRLVVAILILSGVASVALLGEEQKNPAAIAKFLCSGICALLIAASIVTQIRSTSSTIESLGNWIELVMPLAVTVMSALGATVSSGALQTGDDLFDGHGV